MRVVIADDSGVVLQRLVSLLSELEGIAVVAQARDGVEGTEAIRAEQPDAVILDIQMPRGNGIEVLDQIRKEKLSPVVIMLTNYPYPQYRKRCIDAGAKFFFDKSKEFERIREVLEELAISQKTKEDGPHGAAEGADEP